MPAFRSVLREAMFAPGRRDLSHPLTDALVDDLAADLLPVHLAEEQDLFQPGAGDRDVPQSGRGAGVLRHLGP